MRPTIGGMRRSVLVAAAMALIAMPAVAQKKYDSGVTDTEIKIGNTMPYSGPASSYGTIGKVEAAYFKMINDRGGVNGRKINFITYDDGYSPPKAVEQVRKLVESDEVFVVFNPLGTPTNTAIQKYLNSKKMPQLFVATGATKWGNPKEFPWTIGWQPSYQSEGKIYAKWILDNHPNAKIGIVSQNDDAGKDYVKGLKDGLGAKVSMIVKEATYEPTDPTIDSQIVLLKASGADLFVNLTIPKFAAQAIKKIHEIDWKPVHILASVAASVGATLKPAGFDNAQGIISATYMKDATDPQWKDDPAMKEFFAFMDKYYPDGSKDDSLNLYGYTVASGLVKLLQQCGDELTRENAMKQAASLNLEIGQLLPGIKVKTSADDFFPIEQMQLQKFKGERWELFGPIIEGLVGG